MAEIECQELFPDDRLVVCRDRRPLWSADATRWRAERAFDKRKMCEHFDLKIGEGFFS